MQRLKTMPKVGRIASLTFLAAADNVKRFSSSRKLVGYSGPAPTVRQSGDRTEYGAISREGRRMARPSGRAIATKYLDPEGVTNLSPGSLGVASAAWVTL